MTSRAGINRTHGHASGGKSSSEYRSWQNMLSRCQNVNDHGYARYGGRGIVVCDRWLNSFENFYADLGQKPSAQHTLDRIDVNGNYEPSNCRWATALQQANNQRGNVWLTFYGLRKTAAEWSRISQVHQNTIRNRLRAGWTPQQAVWTPPRPARNLNHLKSKSAV